MTTSLLKKLNNKLQAPASNNIPRSYVLVYTLDIRLQVLNDEQKFMMTKIIGRPNTDGCNCRKTFIQMVAIVEKHLYRWLQFSKNIYLLRKQDAVVLSGMPITMFVWLCNFARFKELQVAIKIYL